jgi:hypothetical protein
MVALRRWTQGRRREARSGEAIQENVGLWRRTLGCFAALAMRTEAVFEVPA